MTTATTDLSKLSASELQAMIAKLQSDNMALSKERESKVRLAVSEKGALSVYGMGRFPVTLYRQQWETLISLVPRLQTFINDNASSLKQKE